MHAARYGFNLPDCARGSTEFEWRNAWQNWMKVLHCFLSSQAQPEGQCVAEYEE